MWWALTVMGLWGNIIKSKYMNKLPLELWLCREKFNCSSSYLIWCSLLIGLSYITPDISGQVGRGNCIYIGIDPMVGIAQPLLSNSLLDWLLGKNFVILKDIYVQNDQLSPHWISSSGLGLSGTWDTEWNAYVDYLYNASISLNSDRDEIFYGLSGRLT